VCRTVLAACALALYGIAFGQSDNRVALAQTFHVEGTVFGPLNAVIPHVEIHFAGVKGDQTVTTDTKGFYQIDLPFGTYTMTALLAPPGPPGPNRASFFTKYTRFFQVTSATTITLNAYLYPSYFCDGVWTGEDAEEAYKDGCGGEDSFLVPSRDAAPLRLDIQYARRKRGEMLISYKSSAFLQRRVLVTYNLFALQADSVEYSGTDGTIKAYGNVVIEDQSGQTSATSAAFKFEHGKATQFGN
jgi:hypothetical protein